MPCLSLGKAFFFKKSFYMKPRFKTVDIFLDNSEVQKEVTVDIPDGVITHIGTVTQGNSENKIINLTVLQGQTTHIEPMDVKFLEKTAGGTFQDSLMPVDNLDGGLTYKCKIVANELTRTSDIYVQVLFVVQSREQVYQD